MALIDDGGGSGGGSDDGSTTPGDNTGDLADTSSGDSILPTWIFVLRPLAERISRYGLVGAIVGIVLAFLIEDVLIPMWAAILGSIDFVMSSFAQLPELVLLGPLDAVFSPIASLTTGLWTGYTGWALATAAGFGPAAPFAALLLISPPVIVTGFLFQLGLGLLDVYLPLSELPIIGWVVR